MLRRGDGGGRPSDPLETGTVFLKIRDGVVLLESIAHGSPQYNRGMGFLKNVVTLLHLWSIDPRISLSIIGETGLLEDCSCPRQRRLTGSSPDGFVAETPPASACNLSSNLDGRLNTLIYWPKQERIVVCVQMYLGRKCLTWSWPNSHVHDF